MTLDWTAAGVSLKLAGATTAILLIGGLPLAYALSRTTWRGKSVIVALVTLPLVLPPTVLGFYLLLALGPQSPLGRGLNSLCGTTLPFTFSGLLIACVIGNLPFAVRPFLAAFESLDRRYVEAAWCLGASRWETFRSVTLPLCRSGILTGTVLTFSHCLGEFGVVLMVGGNIPGVTRTLSISIYDDVQALNYPAASWTAGVLVAVSFGVLLLVQSIGAHRPGRSVWN